MTNFSNEITTAKAWATSHLILALGIGFAAGVLLGAILL